MPLPPLPSRHERVPGPGRFGSARSVLALLVLALGVRLWVALALPLISQESYHWEYATHLDLSYFDHPPLTGWAIAFGMFLFGSGTFGIRAASVLFAVGTTLAGLALVRDFGGKERAQASWVVATLVLPILGFGMNLAMTEGPLLFGWMLALWSLWRARSGGWGWWLVAGTGMGITILSKYTAVFLLPAMLLVIAADPEMRRQIRTPAPWAAGLIALLGAVPVVIWNAENRWASFAFQATSRYRLADLDPMRSLSSLAGQLVVLTPVFLILIALSIVWWIRRLRDDPRAIWILAFGLPLPIYMALQSPWSLVKLNWLAPAYLSLVIGTILWIEIRDASRRRPGWRFAVRASAVFGLFLLVASPVAARLTPWFAGNHWSGWETVADRAEYWEEQIDGRGAEEGSVFFFSFGANETAALEYWLHREHDEASPSEPVFPDNVLGGRGLAFDYWEIPGEMAGKDAIAVIASNKAPSDRVLIPTLEAHFESVRLVETVDVRLLGVPVQRARIWVCRGYVPPGSAAPSN